MISSEVMSLLQGPKGMGLASLSPAGRCFKVHPKRVASLFFGIGADDGQGMRQELHRFVAGVKAARPTGVRLGYREFDGEGHMSAPLRTFWRGMECIIADPRLPDAIIEHFTTRAFLAMNA